MKGIGPYARGKILPFNRAWFKVSAGLPSSVPGCARSTFPVGEGFLPAGEGFLRRGLFYLRLLKNALIHAA